MAVKAAIHLTSRSDSVLLSDRNAACAVLINCKTVSDVIRHGEVKVSVYVCFVVKYIFVGIDSVDLGKCVVW